MRAHSLPQHDRQDEIHGRETNGAHKCDKIPAEHQGRRQAAADSATLLPSCYSATGWMRNVRGTQQGLQTLQHATKQHFNSIGPYICLQTQPLAAQRSTGWGCLGLALNQQIGNEPRKGRQFQSSYACLSTDT